MSRIQLELEIASLLKSHSTPFHRFPLCTTVIQREEQRGIEYFLGLPYAHQIIFKIDYTLHSLLIKEEE
jgi:hypothetical protein